MAFTITLMKEHETSQCGLLACHSSIGISYGFTQEIISHRLKEAFKRNDLLLVAKIDDVIAGFAWIDERGAFSSAPYLRLIVVDENVRGRHVGSLLLETFESRTQHIGRDYLLLVSDFNQEAIHFYEKHGYVKRGELPDFAKKGITELMMVKKREEDVF